MGAMKFRWLIVTVALVGSVRAAHAQDDDDDDDDDDGNSNRRMIARRTEALELLEAVAHANDPLLARRAYDALHLTDEKGTPGQDFDKASDAHKEWAAANPDRVKWFGDPAHAKAFAELHLALDWDGDDRLLQAASSAG